MTAEQYRQEMIRYLRSRREIGVTDFELIAGFVDHLCKLEKLNDKTVQGVS